MWHLDIDRTKDVVAKRFGATFAEAAKQFGLEKDQWFDEDRNPFGIHLLQDPHNGHHATIVDIGFKGYLSLIRFTIQVYPSCCGTMLFHTFSVDEHKVPQEALEEIMDTFFKENLENLRGSNRIEVMMVEIRFNSSGDYAFRNPLDEPEPIENPKIKYQSLWNFFHKYAKRVRTRLEVNRNTHNILHNMEVIF